MARSQPYGFACSGGLVDSANRFDLFKAPGVATTLRNFEVAVEGGYRRINGYSLFGGGSSARPNTTEDIEGLVVYADGVVAVAGNDIFFSQDGTSWLQINKASVSGSGDNYSTFTGRSELSLTSLDQCEFDDVKLLALICISSFFSSKFDFVFIISRYKSLYMVVFL